MKWIEYKHLEWSRLSPRWNFVWKMYDGAEYIDTAERLLKQKNQGESKAAFEERARFADFTPIFSQAIETLSGMVESLAADAVSRDWGILEDKEIRTNADGKNNNWEVVMSQSAVKLLLFQRAWILIEGVVGGTAPKLHVLNPETVTNWRYKDGKLAEALLYSPIAKAASLEEEVVLTDSYLHYRLDGWTRYTKSGLDKNNSAIYTMDGEGAYRYVDKSGSPILPIYEANLGFERYVAYPLAKKCDAIFQLESSRDFLLYNANHPKLVIREGHVDTDKMIENMKGGNNWLQGNWDYIAPNTNSATLTSEVLERKKNDFYKAVYQDFNSAVKGNKTATEVVYENASSEAFLNLLAQTLDSLEQHAGYLMSQTYTANANQWDGFSVMRSRRFRPVSVDVWLKTFTDYFVGKTIPIGKTALKSGVVKSLAALGIVGDDAEIDEAIEAFITNDTQQNQLEREFGL